MNTPTPLRLGFAGTPEFAVPALQALQRSRHGLAVVYTQPDRPAGRGQALKASAVKRCALEAGLDVRQPGTLKTAEAAAALRELGLDALVVVAYGLLLPPAVLAAPRLGCFNIHASLLPRWRGAAPIQRAVLAGDAVTGVTIMRMEAGLDTGPLLAARSLPIDERASAGLLHEQLAAAGAELIVATLDDVAAGRAREVPQPEVGVSYAHKIDKSEALIDWREPAAAIARRVRAFNPWPVAETRLNGVQLRIWDAEVAAAESAGSTESAASAAPPGTVLGASAEVACGSGSLRLLTLQLAGRKPLPAAEFQHSQRLAGAVLG